MTTRRGRGEGGIYQTAEGFWTASIELPSHDGTRRRKIKKSKDKSIVAKWLTEQHKELATHGDLATSSPTLKSWAEYWLDNIAAKRIRPNTLAGYRSELAYITTAIGHVRLDKLTTAQIRRAEDGMVEQGLSSTTALMAHRVLRRALEDARREGKVGRNVADLMDAPRRAVTEIHALTLEEALAVIGRAIPALAAEPYDPLPALWASYLLTGTRKGELLGLEWDRISGTQIDLSWQLQYIKKGSRLPADYEVRPISGQLFWTRPKTRSGWRIIPLIEPLKSLLAEHRARAGENPWGLVFTLDERPVDTFQVSKLWKAVTPNPSVTPHGLRHSTVDLLYEAGVPEDLIMQIVGHSQVMVTRGYKSPTKIARARAAMEQFSAFLGVTKLSAGLPASGGDEDGDRSVRR